MLKFMIDGRDSKEPCMYLEMDDGGRLLVDDNKLVGVVFAQERNRNEVKLFVLTEIDGELTVVSIELSPFGGVQWGSYMGRLALGNLTTRSVNTVFSLEQLL